MMTIKQPELLNAQQLHRENPVTFLVPSEKKLKQLRPGDLVKVCFPVEGRCWGMPTSAERFWVELESVEFPVLTGRVDNDLRTHDLAYNDRIRFHVDNVYQITTAKEMKQAKK